MSDAIAMQPPPAERASLLSKRALGLSVSTLGVLVVALVPRLIARSTLSLGMLCARAA